ncbi:MAG: hypothetical protein R3C49_18355 [Planctomycetaceae bacterium]
MRFVLTGDHPELSAMAAAIQSAPDHRMVCCCCSGDVAVQIARQGVDAVQVGSPEEAVSHPDADVAVIGFRRSETSIALVRQASQADCHVVVIPPDDVSTAFSFEAHLLLDESRRGIVSLTGRWRVPAPPPESCHDLQQISLSLPLVEHRLDRMQLLAVDAVCGLGLPFSQVTALDVPGADGRLLSRTITLASSAEAGRKSAPAVIHFGQEVSETLPSVIQLRSGQAGSNPAQVRLAFQDADLPADTLTGIVSCLKDRDACQREMEQFSNTLELMEGLQKSLRRRRTVDVYFDGVSERSAFKTQMTAIGCGVLSWVLFGLVAYLVVAQLLNLPPIVLHIARILWIAPVVLFLLAQFLLPLARDRSHTPNRPQPNQPPKSE